MEILNAIPGWRMRNEQAGMDDEEKALVRRAQLGDEAAIERLLDMHSRIAWTVCSSMLPHSDAQDALQDSLLKALYGLPTFRCESSFRTWLLRIVTRTCLNFKRKRPVDSLSDADQIAEGSSLETDTVGRLAALDALSQLQPRHRVLIMLREVEELSVNEIAATMGWRENKVRNELFRARQMLRAWRENQ
jgi:RNA polymerase sigma-70 factor (ECF subfamily)